MSRFSSGFLTAIFVTSLVQDALGLDWVVRNWIDSRVTVPPALAGLVLVAWTSSRGEDDEQ